MCFAPQQRALFRHRNFQKWSGAGVLCTFWLRNVLRATTACTFSTSQLPKVFRSWGALYFFTCKCASRHNGVHFLTSQLPKVVRACGALYILTSKCASRHNGVQFLISHLARWLRTRRFSEPTFQPSGATNHWKNTVFRDFPTFSRTCIFFLLTLSLLWSSLFYSSLLSDSSHLCFSSVHIVGSLTSKLPSMIIHEYSLHKCIGFECHWDADRSSQAFPMPWDAVAQAATWGSPSADSWQMGRWFPKNSWMAFLADISVRTRTMCFAHSQPRTSQDASWGSVIPKGEWVPSNKDWDFNMLRCLKVAGCPYSPDQDRLTVWPSDHLTLHCGARTRENCSEKNALFVGP